MVLIQEYPKLYTTHFLNTSLERLLASYFRDIALRKSKELFVCNKDPSDLLIYLRVCIFIIYLFFFYLLLDFNVRRGPKTNRNLNVARELEVVA
jgi:hypothetical protein